MLFANTVSGNRKIARLRYFTIQYNIPPNGCDDDDIIIVVMDNGTGELEFAGDSSCVHGLVNDNNKKEIHLVKPEIDNPILYSSVNII